MMIVNNTRHKNSDGKSIMALYFVFAQHATEQMRMDPALIEPPYTFESKSANIVCKFQLVIKQIVTIKYL